MRKIITALLIFATSWSANAGFGLKNVFDNLHVNTTGAGVYKDSASGWYSGGGASIRTKNTAIQPFAFTPPSINTGCNGIDVYMGSFSMFLGDVMMDLIKNIDIYLNGGSGARKYDCDNDKCLNIKAPETGRVGSKGN